MTSPASGIGHATVQTDTLTTLPRSLSLLNLTAFGVGSTIGAGIFVLTGQVAATNAGPAVALSFGLAGLACFFACYCYAELAAMMPVAGSAYSYTYTAFGRTAAWAVGWSLVLEYLFSAAFVAIGWAGYLDSTLADYLGVHLPALFAGAPLDVMPGPGGGDHLFFTGSVVNLPAVLITLFCTALLVRGTEFSAKFNNIIVAAKLLVIVLVIVVGLAHASPANWKPFIPANTGHFGDFGLSGMVRGAAIVFFSYVGFDAVSCMAQEAKNPQRMIPRGLMISLAIVTVLYVLMALAATGLAPYSELNVADPIYVALGHGGPGVTWLKLPVALVVLVGLISVLLVTLLGQVRIFYAMGFDGLMPKSFTHVHRRFGTPHIGTIVVGLVAAIIAGVFPLKLLGELVSIGTLFAFAGVCAAVIILRRKMPDAKRPFRVPFVPYLPIAGILCCFALMASLPLDTWLRLLFWLIIGFAIYYWRNGWSFRIPAEFAAGKEFKQS